MVLSSGRSRPPWTSDRGRGTRGCFVSRNLQNRLVILRADTASRRVANIAIPVREDAVHAWGGAGQSHLSGSRCEHHTLSKLTSSGGHLTASRSTSGTLR